MSRLTPRVIHEIMRCIVADAEKEHKHDGRDDRERQILIVDSILAGLEQHRLEVREITDDL